MISQDATNYDTSDIKVLHCCTCEDIAMIWYNRQIYELIPWKLSRYLLLMCQLMNGIRCGGKANSNITVYSPVVSTYMFCTLQMEFDERLD